MLAGLMMLLRAIRISALVPLLLASLFICVPQLKAQGTAALIRTNSFWKYWTDTIAPAGWTTDDFDDSQWPQGQAELGYGDGDERTQIPERPLDGERYITSYFRYTFQLEPTLDDTDHKRFKELLLGLRRDDGGIVYLNGVEVFRSNMPDGAISNATLAVTN